LKATPVGALLAHVPNTMPLRVRRYPSSRDLVQAAGVGDGALVIHEPNTAPMAPQAAQRGSSGTASPVRFSTIFLYVAHHPAPVVGLEVVLLATPSPLLELRLLE